VRRDIDNFISHLRLVRLSLLIRLRPCARESMSLASTVANGMQMRTTTKGGTLQSRNSGPHADSHPCTAFLNLVAAAKGDAQLPADLGPLMPDCRSPSGRTPVIVAALAGNPTAVERLASAGYSVAEVGRRVAGVFFPSICGMLKLEMQRASPGLIVFALSLHNEKDIA